MSDTLEQQVTEVYALVDQLHETTEQLRCRLDELLEKDPHAGRTAEGDSGAE